MKQNELIQYRDCFNNIDEWRTLTETLDKKTIMLIKRLMLKHEIYEDFDFNPDHLEAIEKLKVIRKAPTVGPIGMEKEVCADFDRINSTIELTIKENGKVFNKSKVSVNEAIIESFFRDGVEHNISRNQMEEEGILPIMQKDAPVYYGTVTWYKDDQVFFQWRGGHATINLDYYIEVAKKTIIISIEHDADYHEHND